MKRNRFFYPRLAFSNIKKNAQTYLPYLLTAVLTVGMFYVILALSGNPGLRAMAGGNSMGLILSFGTIITGIFAVVFLFYTNSFLMKRRKKEFGVFHILGMEKRHLFQVIFYETLFIAVLSIVLGLLFGLVFSKLAFLLLVNMFDSEIPLYFTVSSEYLVVTAVFFAALFLLILLNSMRQIRRSNPIDLLRGGQFGEKEPKAKWAISLLGLVCLGAGYYLSITTKNPIAALTMFFLAVILVIIGTYLLFTSGSISVLKLLKKNKQYYYKSNRFISVSGMMYRMKQNAVGLGNICILSTMVLVMVSMTFSLYIGADDIMRETYPRELEATAYYEEGLPEQMEEIVQGVLRENNREIKSQRLKISLSGVATRQGNRISAQSGDPNLVLFSAVPLEQYNADNGTNETLDDGEILLYGDDKAIKSYESLQMFDQDYRVKAQALPDEELRNPYMGAMTIELVVRDMQALQELAQAQNREYEQGKVDIQISYGVDMEGERQEIIALTGQISDAFEAAGLGRESGGVSVESRSGSWNIFMGLYGGLFFIGMFLGILFIMATILIMYYKQISEGYDDRERFQIMKKVGLSDQEVKKTIRSQVLGVFFLPLIVAVIHLAFAFPIILRLLALFAMTNVRLFVLCTGGCVLVFTVLYVLVYTLTAKSYYKIVR